MAGTLAPTQDPAYSLPRRPRRRRSDAIAESTTMVMTSLMNLGRLQLRTRIGRPALREPRSAHLVGICGSGMKALAELLTGLGWQVSGSDLQTPGVAIQALQARGLRIHHGHHAQFVPPNTDVVVHSPAVSAANPELRHAARLQIPRLTYSEMLGQLMRERTGVCIAGTHGKSTTTAMVASVLRDAGMSPSAAIGAELRTTGQSGWAGESDLFVVESCEYRRSFLDLQPKFAAILGIETDHFDCYASLDQTVDAFREFAACVAADGVLLVRGDCVSSLAAARMAKARVATFSELPGSDWRAADWRDTPDGGRFRIFHRGDFFAEITLSIPGRHHQMNALAAAALCHHAGASAAQIRDGLLQFSGIKRRFEPVGSWRGITMVDDYAHHPTAVAATLSTARRRFGKRRIWCAFQPHQVSRTEALMGDFAGSFVDADRVLIAPVFAARESDNASSVHASHELARRICAQDTAARFCSSLDRIVATLDDEARPGDVLLTLGAGDIDRVHHEFTGRLQRYHPE